MVRSIEEKVQPVYISKQDCHLASYQKTHSLEIIKLLQLCQTFSYQCRVEISRTYDDITGYRVILKKRKIRCCVSLQICKHRLMTVDLDAVSFDHQDVDF